MSTDAKRTHSPLAPVLGGVCARISARWGFDVSMLRVAFALLTLAYGAGAVAYAVLWVLVVRDEAGGRHGVRSALGARWVGARRGARASVQGFQRDLRARYAQGGAGGSQRWAWVLVTTGAMLLAGSFGLLSWLSPTRALALGAIALGVALVVRPARGGGAS